MIRSGNKKIASFLVWFSVAAISATAKADTIENIVFSGTATCLIAQCSAMGSGPVTGTYTLDVTDQVLVAPWSFSTPFGVLSSTDTGASNPLANRFGEINPGFAVVTYSPIFSDGIQFFFPTTDPQELGSVLAGSDGCFNVPGGTNGGPACYPYYAVTGSTGLALTTQGGPPSSPVFLLGNSIFSVSSTIAGAGSEEYYAFVWAGGDFSASAAITGASGNASYLFSEGVLGNCSSGGSGTLDSGDGFASTIAVSNLAPGQYCIGLNANSGADPQFTLSFNAPVQGVSTPEPSTALLLALGIGITIFKWRRSHLAVAKGTSTNLE